MKLAWKEGLWEMGLCTVRELSLLVSREIGDLTFNVRRGGGVTSLFKMVERGVP